MACASFIAEGESNWHEGDSRNSDSGPEWKGRVLFGWRGGMRGWGGEGGRVMAYGAY